MELSEGNKVIINLINEVIALDINEKKAKDSKFNIYDFASKDKDPYRECMCGVYHDKGWRVASNAQTLIAIKEELGVPIKYIGVGEGIDDLQPFNAQEFVDALFEKDQGGVEA